MKGLLREPELSRGRGDEGDVRLDTLVQHLSEQP